MIKSLEPYVCDRPLVGIMMKLRCKGVFPAIFFLMFCITVAAGAADLQSGLKAYKQGDYRSAFDIFSTLAAQGIAEAQYSLGIMYHNGKGVAQDDAKAVYWYRKAAAQGEAGAQFNLGFMYVKGEGVPQDYEKAFYWFRKAAAQGYTSAQYNLGIMYVRGEGVAQDDAKAVYWYRKAAAQGAVDAQFNLGFMYHNGKGVPQDYEKAFYWFQKAAAQGYTSAQYNLGIMYFRGEVVAQDYVSALKWFILAAVDGNQEIIKVRDTLSESLTPAQVAEAQRMARNFSPHVVSPTSSPASAQASSRKPLVAARPLVRKIQQHLVFLGYNPGPVDGFSGSRTTAAIKAFQRDWEITPDGIISESLLALLKIARTVKENNASTKQPPQQAAVSGTAFLVSSRYAVTNYHVVKGAHHLVLCLGDDRIEASLIAHDSTNDLAVIKLSIPLSPGKNSRQGNTDLTSCMTKDQGFARFRDSGIIQLGEQVMIAGYPLRGYLSSGLNVSRGEVSALNGPANDCRLFQISAPVQPGNSGGPLLDKSGLVIGIVVAKLNAIKFAKETGDIPQNVNFAVKGALIKSFLDVNGIYYAEEKTQKVIDSQTKACQAARYTFPLECY